MKTNKKIFLLSIIAIIIIIIASITITNITKKTKKEEILSSPATTTESLKDETKDQEEITKKYEDCLSQPYKSSNLDQEFNELFQKLDKESVGIYFTELNNNYEYSTNPNKAYYSGCTIKIFDVIYYIDKVRSGEFTGQETITYLPSDKHVFSDHMDKHKYYEEVPVTKLIEYMMTISDNTSHFMFIRQYGAENINNYMKNKYNINLHFTSNHPFESNYTASFANESLKVLYDLLSIDDEYSKIVKEAMNNEEVNALNFDDKKFLHKYGELVPYHNDIGINDSTNPYLISILTTYANDDYMGLISNIHKEIYTIYENNLKEKENYCKTISTENQ